MSTAVAPAAAGHRRGLRGLRGLRALGSVAGVAVLLVVVVPLVAGAPWAAVGRTLAQVPWPVVAGLGVLWLAGLLAHTITLTAALPRLTHGRALLLSLTGSAVSNVLPFGGAAGIALNYRMTRAWGHDRAAFAAYTVVTNVWDVLFKLTLPALALGWLALAGHLVLGPVVSAAVAATVVLALLSATGGALLVHDPLARRLGGACEGLVGGVLRVLRCSRRPAVADGLDRVRRECRELLSGSWRRLSLGMLLYSALLLALLAGCLAVTGAGLPLAAVFAGFAVERVLTLVGVTPGGAGVVEVGLVGLLVALGGDPVGTVAGTLLYRVFTYGLEIPVGGLGLLVWLRLRRAGAAPSAVTGGTA
ncbi:flippase-like domain-containing protein [Nocardioides sp. KIGAM211]|uniref:Flippase-like domain-containing protein n=1 Tax=Nocardioides luti TaxID=2761101 RepID=A0A7X0RF14_9ACTN|nr:lysylphosphatidylglycerol synthase domain-containing protein [Nocardioides luti]MBB6626995.1 flippase-like domain-containing protein [Nocardioides luti]